MALYSSSPHQSGPSGYEKKESTQTHKQTNKQLDRQTDRQTVCLVTELYIVTLLALYYRCMFEINVI